MVKLAGFQVHFRMGLAVSRICTVHGMLHVASNVCSWYKFQT